MYVRLFVSLTSYFVSVRYVPQGNTYSDLLYTKALIATTADDNLKYFLLFLRDKNT